LNRVDVGPFGQQFARYADREHGLAGADPAEDNEPAPREPGGEQFLFPEFLLPGPLNLSTPASWSAACSAVIAAMVPDPWRSTLNIFSVKGLISVAIATKRLATPLNSLAHASPLT
jgi:hypothetical protein